MVLNNTVYISYDGINIIITKVIETRLDYTLEWAFIKKPDIKTTWTVDKEYFHSLWSPISPVLRELYEI